MLHRLFQSKSPKSIAEGYIRRILYMYKTHMEDTFCTVRFPVEEMHLALQGYGLTPTDYYLHMFHQNCAVFLYNKKKNRYERVQRRFMENNEVYVLRPSASITLDTGDRILDHGKYGCKAPHTQKINGKEVVGDHWMPEYVYYYNVSN